MRTEQDFINQLEFAAEKGLEQGLEQGLEKGREQGLEQGREQGIAEGQRMVAAKMLAAGMPAEQIMQFTGLSEKEINA